MMPTEDISKGVGGNHQDNETTNMQCKKEATQDLILATMDPNVEEAQDGIARGADVNHKNEHGMSPLIIACGGIGPRQMLHELLRAGADVNLCDNENWSPLMYAASVGQVPLVEELLKWNANLEARSNSDWTALTRASFRGNANVVRTLLRAGADHTARTEGKTGLEWAKENQHKGVVTVYQQELDIENR